MIHIKNIITNILVLVSGFVGMLVLRFLDQYLHTPVFQSPAYIGILLIVIGMSIRIWASISFSKNQVKILDMNAHPKLVTSGPFKYFRNPLYVGIMLITLGFVSLAGSIVGLVLTVTFFIFWNLLIICKEEPDLKKRFGEEFDAYQLQVNRWVYNPMKNEITISSRLTNLLKISIPLYIVHAIEEYSTGILRMDHFFQWASGVTKIPQNSIYLTEQILIVLLLLWAIYRPKRWLLILIGLMYVYELVHITRAISIMAYYPGLITAVFFPVIGYLYWRELLTTGK